MVSHLSSLPCMGSLHHVYLNVYIVEKIENMDIPYLYIFIYIK